MKTSERKVLKNAFWPVQILLFGYLSFTSFTGQTPENHQEYRKHGLAVVVSHSQVNEGVNDAGSRPWLSLPFWGINYPYGLSHFYDLQSRLK